MAHHSADSALPSNAVSLDVLTIGALTLDERAELERAVDGPITPVMIADKLRARLSPTAEEGTSPRYLRALLIWAQADLKFYRSQVADVEMERAALMADRDNLYTVAEKDRKIRHIAVLDRQRDALIQHCGLYQIIARDAARKLAMVQDSTST